MINKKVLLVLIISCNHVLTIKPPGYVEKPKTPDDHPPKYEYGYSVANEDKASQGHKETRDGDNTKGNYYVNLPEGQSQANIKYVADDWGYHPIVRYSTQNEHSTVSAHFALGHSAVQAFNQENSQGNKDTQILKPISQQQNGRIYPQHLESTKLHPINLHNNENIVSTVNTVESSYQSSHEVSTLSSADGISKLVASTQNLITNEDVLDINDAVELSQNRLDQNSYENSDNTIQNKVNQNDILKIAEYSSNEFKINEKHENEYKTHFNSPIVVEENYNGHNEQKNDFSSSSTVSPFHISSSSTMKNDYEKEVNIFPTRDYFPPTSPSPTPHNHQNSLKQINVEILEDHNKGQFLKETSYGQSKQSDDNYNQKLEDQYITDTNQNEPQSRQFLKKFKTKQYSNNLLSRDNNAIFSTTKTTTQTTTKSTIKEEKLVVTQRPISNKFLAPIQAGLRLSNADKNVKDCVDDDETQKKKSTEEGNAGGSKTIVEVQKSVNIKNFLINHEGRKIVEKSHQTQIPAPTQPTHPQYKSPQPTFGTRFVPKQILTQTQIIHQPIIIEKPVDRFIKQDVIIEKNIPTPVYVDRVVEKHVPVPVTVEKKVPYPVEVPKYYEKQVKVQVPVDRIVEKHVPYPVEVEKIVEKQVPVDRIIEKKVPVHIQIEKKVPVPYPVEKIVDRPIHHTHYVDRPYPVEKIVEKKVPVPYQVDKIVEKIVNRPYPVEKKVPYPVEVEKIVEKPITVEKVVEKIVNRPVPYPVEVPKYIDRPYAVEKVVEKIIDRPVNVEKIVEKQVNVPYPVQQIVEKFIDRPVEVEKVVEKQVRVPYPVEVNKYIDRPYPVEKIVEKPIHVPYAVEKIVEKYIDRPVQVEKIIEKEVKVPIEVEKIVEKYIDRPYPVEKYIDRPYPVEKVVEKIVDRPIHIQVPVGVPVQVPVQYPVEVPVQVPVPYPVTYTVEVPYEVPVQKPQQTVHQHYQQIKSIQPVITKGSSGNSLFSGFNLNALFAPTHTIRHIYLPPNPSAIKPTEQLNYFSKQSNNPNIKLKHVVLDNSNRSPKIIGYQPHQYSYNYGKSTVLEPVASVSNPKPVTIKHVHLTNPTSIVQNSDYSISTHYGEKPKPVYGAPYLFDHGEKTTHLHVNLNGNNGWKNNYYAENFGYQSGITSGIYKDEYYGPVPINNDYWGYKPISSNNFHLNPKFRRQSDYAKNLRIEYGFKPPMVPSVEIDENGNPINKGETK